jgi:hypothetical protein
MKKEVGTSFGLAALLMVSLYPVLPESSKPPVTGAAAKKVEKAAESPPESNAAQAPMDGPWLALRSYFRPSTQPSSGQTRTPGCESIASLLGRPAHGRSDREALRACVQRLSGLPDDFETAFSSWSIVATVTDPMHTRMALTLDRQIEAIQAAAAAADWSFVGQWLPWRDRIVLPEDDMMKRRLQRRLMREQERVPGVLLFRRKGSGNCTGQPVESAASQVTPGAPESGKPRPKCPEELLTIFLVGETPTTGVPGGPFFAAMNLASVMTNGGHQIGLLGPNYSGSLASLGNLVHAWKFDNTDSRTASLSPTAYSGSVSSRIAAQDFTRKTGLKFRSNITDSPVYEATLEKVLEKYKLDRRHVARLVEYGTVFGSDFLPGVHRPPGDEPAKPDTRLPIRSYIFPLGISQLRSAYREQAGGNEGKQSGTPTSALTFSFRDSDEGEDTVPSFSKQTPFTQDAILTTIMGDLRRREIRLVDIVATNPMDTLFLCRVLKSECPDARILIEDAEILFISAARQDPLRGTLFLSTYPMFAQGEEWLQQANSSVLLFPGPGFQGVYNALSFLLGDIKALTGEIHLRGWGKLDDPPGQKHEPGIWLLTLTRTGFVPIDAFDSNDPCSLLRVPDAVSGKPICGEGEAPPTVEDGLVRKEVRDKMPPPPLSWLLATILLAVASLLYCGCVFTANQPWGTRWPSSFTMGYAGGALELPIFSAGAALASMLCFLVIPFWLFYPGPLWWPRTVAIVASCAAVAPPALFVATRAIRRPAKNGVSWWNYLFVAVLYLSMVVPWVYCCVQGWADSAATWLFAYRAFDLSGCVSPAVPMLATCSALGAASVMRACRYVAADRMSESLQSLPIQLREQAGAVSATLMSAPELDGKHSVRWSAPLVFAFAVMLIANMEGAIDPFDRAGFVWAIRIANFWLLWMVFRYCQDLLSGWAVFKDLLITAGSELSDRDFERFSVRKSAGRSYFVRARWQMQRLAFTLAFCFVALAVFFPTYSPQAPNALGRWLLVLFFGVGTLVIFVLAKLEKDFVLSKLYDRTPGKLDAEFWLRMAAFMALPLIGLVSHMFPELARFVSNWVQPGIEAVR